MILTFILQFNTLVDYSKIAYIVSTLNKWRRTRTRIRTRIRTIPTPKKTSLTTCNNDSLIKLSSEIQFYHSIKHKNQTHKPRLKTYKSQKKKKKRRRRRRRRSIRGKECTFQTQITIQPLREKTKLEHNINNCWGSGYYRFK